MSNYISPYSLKLIGRSGQDRVLYRDYLQQQSLATDVTASVEKVNYAISESSREMIGTLEQLHQRGYEVVTSAVADLSSEIGSGFEGVSWRLDDMSGELKELNAKFDWGFSQMIAEIGGVNDSLQELIAIAKTPAETWAYNQYQIAREAIRRALYPEAVEALERAINGHGDNVGYKLEYRFHYTLGVLHLGDVTNTDTEILDLAKAESSFLTAARYAKTDHPREAGLAMTAAGWAALCQKKLAESESYTKQAIEMHSDNGEAFYQLAKVQMAADRPDEAISNLGKAAGLDPHYTLKAATDLDFLKYEKAVQSLIDSLRHQAKDKAFPAVTAAKQTMAALQEWETAKVFDTEMQLLLDSAAGMEADMNANTLLGFISAKEVADRIKFLGEGLLQEHRRHMQEEVSFVFSGLFSFSSAFRPRVATSALNTFNAANVAMTQGEIKVQNCDDFRQKMEHLSQARELFKAAYQETVRGLSPKKESGGLSGIKRGCLKGMRIGALISGIPILIGFMYVGVVWFVKPDGASDGFPLLIVFGAIPAIVSVTAFGGFLGMIIAAANSSSSDVALKSFLQNIGSLQPLLQHNGIKRPALVFDADAFVTENSVTHLFQPNSQSEGQTLTFYMNLTSVPANDVFPVIKAIRRIRPRLDLAEAKALVENLPQEILRITGSLQDKRFTDRFKQAKQILEATGAKVTSGFSSPSRRP